MAPASPAPGPTHLLDLPDELLQRILDFAPSREAASTAVLSRRWRGLWPTPSGAVNLDTRSYDADLNHYDRLEAFFLGAEVAIAAAHGGSVTTLTVHVHGQDPDTIDSFMCESDWTGTRFYNVHDVLRHPATRRVVELSIAASISGDRSPADDRSCESAMPGDRDEAAGLYKLNVDAVPSEALRVLRVANCRGLEEIHPVFQCLEVLHLRRCAVSLYSLQDIVAASPQLTTLQLDRVFVTTKFRRPTPNIHPLYDEDEDEDEDYNDSRVQSLCCPGVTNLVLLNCSQRESVTIELDVPMVQVFRYRGYLHRFVLTSPPRDVMRADLHFLEKSVYYHTRDTSEYFWLFVKSFSNAKVLKLKLNFPISDVAVDDKERYDELMGETLFSNLDLLEMEGQYRHKSKGAGVAIGNLLQCCPAVRDLRIYLNTVEDPPNNERRYLSHRDDSEGNRRYLDKEAQLDFHKSVDHFMRRRDPVVSLGGDDKKFKVSNIPGLTDKCFHFNCLRFSLKRVTLQFHMDKPNCFGVQLVKFFFEKAMVLEEMYIDDGNQKLWDHMHRQIAGCTSSLQPSSEFFLGVSKALYLNQLNSSNVCGRFPYPRLKVNRRIPWTKRSCLTILPLDRQ